MKNANDYIGMLMTVVATLTPICLAWIGLMQKKKDRQDRAYRQLQEDNRKLENDEKLRLDKEKEEQMENLASEMKELREEVQKFKLCEVNEQLKLLTDLNQINFEYVQSLSSVVTTLGDIECSSPQPSPKTKELKSALEHHREMEKAITIRLYKIKY